MRQRRCARPDRSVGLGSLIGFGLGGAGRVGTRSSMVGQTTCAYQRASLFPAIRAARPHSCAHVAHRTRLSASPPAGRRLPQAADDVDPGRHSRASLSAHGDDAAHVIRRCSTPHCRLCFSLPRIARPCVRSPPAHASPSLSLGPVWSPARAALSSLACMQSTLTSR